MCTSTAVCMTMKLMATTSLYNKQPPYYKELDTVLFKVQNKPQLTIQSATSTIMMSLQMYRVHHHTAKLMIRVRIGC